MNFKSLFYVLISLILNVTGAYAATQITTPTVSGTWSLQGSPYYIHNNITVPFDSMLIIKPGVEVVFMGSYSFKCNGNMSAVGNEKDKIVFRSNDTTGFSDINFPGGGWLGITLENYTQFNFPQPTFEYCVFWDMKKFWSYGLFVSTIPLLYINKCEFYHNLTDGTLINLYNNAPSVTTKLRFTNCTIHNNNTGTGMFTLYNDSIIVTGNKFYDNTVSFGFGLFANASTNDMSNNFLLFDNNELYNNTTSELGGGIVNCTEGGRAKISNNYIHHNTTKKNGAIFLQSKSSLVENNRVINNNQVLDGTFCGINDGGSGIQLLGQNWDTEVPGRNTHIVRNNIVANNHSAITGAGLWVQHCQATVVNNTFMNNTSKNPGAAVRAWGTYCKLRLYNNIIFGNKLPDAPNDTAYTNFDCYTALLLFSNNLLDYHIGANFMPVNVQGLATNIYDHNLALMAPTAGAGITYDATNANFSLTTATTNCINRGDNNAPDHGTIDFYGNSRIVGGSIDIGAVEFKGAGPTSIRDKEAGDKIQVFPNPTTGDITIKNLSSPEINTITLMDLFGRILKTFNVEEDRAYTIRIGQYPDATYLLGIETARGTIYKKITLKR